MQLSRPLAALIGVVTVTPVVAVLLVLTLSATTGFQTAQARYESLSLLVRGLTLLLVVLCAFYVWHLTRNRAVVAGNRTSWIVAFLILGPFAELVYWARHIWTRPSDAAVSA